MITFSHDEYVSKVRGCWLGKNVGGTFGAPHEHQKALNNLTFYRPVPTEPIPNDDLDLQLMWLLMLEEQGGREPTLCDFARAWRRFMGRYPWDEYGIASMNLEAGLEPPISGSFRNGYVDNMGAAIRTELWACLAPADPQRAAILALRDATLDHAGGEGVYGAMFWAALQSAAFVESDRDTLIRIGLGVLPLHSMLARAIREALVLHERGFAFEAARERIAQLFSNPSREAKPGQPLPTSLWGGVIHTCYAPVNHAFTVLGWLYGEDFGDALCKAVNCGYDTDCTGATLGATLGIIGGEGAIPAEWLSPIGEEIVIHAFSQPLENAPRDIAELTRRTVALARAPQRVERAQLWRNEAVFAALRELDPHSAHVEVEGATLVFHYNGEPVLHANQTRWVRLSVKSDKTVEAVELRASNGWKIARDGEMWRLFALENGAGEVTAQIAFADGSEVEARFVWVAPHDALFPVEINVPNDPRTGFRLADFKPSHLRP